MQFIVDPSHKSWFAVSDNYLHAKGLRPTLGKLKGQLARTDTWFTDLDDTLAPSPGMKIVKSGVGTEGKKLRYLNWMAITATDVVLGTKLRAWEQYVKKFLQSSEVRQEIETMFTAKVAYNSLYPGIENFFRRLPQNCAKYIVTRDVEEVASAYAQVLGIRNYFVEVTDKGRTVEDVVRENFGGKYGVSGDTLDDQTMVDKLLALQQQGKVDRVVSIWHAKTPRDLNPNFDISTSKDLTALVEMTKRPHQ